MKVSNSEYKVIPVRRYLVVLLMAFMILGILLRALPFHQVLLFISPPLWLLILTFSFASTVNGLSAIRASQYPAPNTYVLSNWTVYKGNKAKTYGKILATFSSIICITCITLVISQTIGRLA